LFVSLLHLVFLHEFGSNNPIGIPCPLDNSPFTPYYVLKDTFSLLLLLFVFFYIVFLTPDVLGHPDNYDKANFLVTPAHIVPEWYFLPLYAVLRSVTNKLLGIFLLFCLFFVLLCLPFFLTTFSIRSNSFKPLNSFFF
jgi:quinol-cytochrome oxidoreductase complex cytochrome b subunit